MLTEMREKIGAMVRSQLPADKLEAIADLAGRALEQRRDAPALSPLETSDREGEMADWLEDHGVAGAWDIAPTLIAAGVGLDWLEEFAEVLPPPNLGARAVLSRSSPRVGLHARRDHRRRRPHLRVARLGEAVHADGPGAAPVVRRPRGPRRHVDDARAQARRRHRDRPRLRPRASRRSPPSRGS